FGCTGDNMIGRTQYFTEYKALYMAYLRVKTNGEVMPLFSEMAQTLPRLRQLFPTDRINLHFMGFDPVQGPFAYTCDGPGCGWGWTHLLATLGWHHFWHHAAWDEIHYHGYLDESVPTGNAGGRGN